MIHFVHRLCTVVALAAGSLMPFASGCAPFATYPPVEGSLGIDNPQYEPVPSIMADAIWYTHQRFGDGRDSFAINLPEGTEPEVYDKVIENLGRGTPMTDPGEWAYHITQIRSRGLQAEADVIYPRAGAPHGFLTVKMRKAWETYEVESAKVWNIPTHVPAPNWYPHEETTELVSEEG